MLAYGVNETMNRNPELLDMSKFRDREFEQALQMLNQISDKGLRASLKASSLWLRIARLAENRQPSAAIRIYRLYIDQLTISNAASNLESAGDYLRRLKSLYVLHGQYTEWIRLSRSLRRRSRALAELITTIEED